MTTRRAFLAGAGALAVTPLLPAMPSAGEGSLWGMTLANDVADATNDIDILAAYRPALRALTIPRGVIVRTMIHRPEKEETQA